MYNYTNGHSIWRTRLEGFINQTARFFPESADHVMVEVCEKNQRCNPDQLSFKSYLARWLSLSAQIAPFTAATIAPILAHSAQAAAKTCNDANQCGSQWNLGRNDGIIGAGQQMSALAIIAGNLFPRAKPQVTADTGGTSKGNPAAGTGEPVVQSKFNSISTADKAGAWIITLLRIHTLLLHGWGGVGWVVDGMVVRRRR